MQAERSIISPVLAAKLAIKKQLERNTPDNGFKFRTLNVSSTPLGYVFTFEGTADISKIWGRELVAVYGTFNSYTNKAVIARTERLNAAQ